MQRVKTTIENTKVDLEHKPKGEQNIIKLLNSKTKDEIEEMKILDRTSAVMEVNRVLTKNNLVIQLERKCRKFELQVRRFNKKFTLLQEKSLPTLKNSNGKLFPLEKYQE